MLRRLVAPTLLTFVLATTASAGEPAETLHRLFDAANHLLLAVDIPDELRIASLRALVSEAFDAREAAALALGPQWQMRSAAEREEFGHLYADLIESAYLGGVGGRARVHDDGIRVSFDSETVQGAEATVVTTLDTRGTGDVPVEYRMRRREQGWAVVDVVVEGLSLARSYRAQIQRVLQTGTYADVVARLRERASVVALAAVAAAKTVAPVRPPEVAAVPVLVASAATVAAAPAPRSFWIQVGAFRDTNAASRVVEALRQHSVMVASGGVRSSPLARVLVGPFVNRAAATTVLKELAAAGYRAFIAFE